MVQNFPTGPTADSRPPSLWPCVTPESLLPAREEATIVTKEAGQEAGAGWPTFLNWR